MQPELFTVPKPLTPMADIVNAAITKGELGAVVARAGVGKTAFLVQAALYAMMTNRNVLHVNLADTVKKTALWYEEIFSLLTTRCGKTEMGFPLTPLLTRRLIMTMKISGFSVDNVRERLMDFIEQDVFSPGLIVLDGLNFDDSQRDTVAALKALCGELSIGAWMSVPAHREEARDERQRPARFAGVADLFDVAWEFLPEGQKIQIRALPTGAAAPTHPNLNLNPSTLLLDIEAP